MYERLLRRVALTLLALLLLLAGFLIEERLRGRISLGRYQRELLSQGVKLSPQDFAVAPPKGENGAPELVQAYQELQQGTVAPNNYPPAMRLTPAGHAIVGFREERWISDKTTNNWDTLATELDANELILARIRAALERPVLDNQLDFSQGAHMSFRHLPVPKSSTRWFGARSQLALHDARPHDALQDLLPCLHLPRLLAGDHLAISELVRIAVVAVDRTLTWEALQADGWTDADLVRLQQAWEELSFADPMVHAVEGEVVFSEACFSNMRKSQADTVAVLFGLADYMPPEDWESLLRKLPAGDALAAFCKKQLYCRVWRFCWLDQSDRHDLEQLQRLVAIGRTGVSNRSLSSIQPRLADLAGEIATRGVYNRLRYPAASVFSLTRVMNRAMHAETERSLTICAIALKRYTLAHGEPPASLDLLVPEFLPSAPIDYIDGRPIRYRRTAENHFVLYSVGDDGKDDGGDPTLPSEKTHSQNLWDRKDVVWPEPAFPSEVEAYRTEAAHN